MSDENVGLAPTAAAAEARAPRPSNRHARGAALSTLWFPDADEAPPSDDASDAAG